MAIKSVYVPEATGSIENGRLWVRGEEHRHMVVSRVRSGDTLEVFDGNGRVWSATLVTTGRDATELDVGPVRMAGVQEGEIILAQALIRHAAFDWILEKAVELGVSRIVPFRAGRSNETGKGRDRRWQRLVVEAAKQSKQFWVPTLDPVRELDAVLSLDAKCRIVLSERSGGRPRDAVTGSPVICLVGPEGGWTDSEMKQIERAGFQPVHLGNQILRAETAAIVGLGLVAYELGVL